MGAGASSASSLARARVREASAAEVEAAVACLGAGERERLSRILSGPEFDPAAEFEGQQKREREAKAQELRRRYPGNPYEDMENTRFAEILRTGSIAVVRSSYFKRCLERGEPFQDRANIPPEEFITGDELIEKWKKYGGKFLMIFSYSWLTADHPDPDLFHLKRIVRILKEMTNYLFYDMTGKLSDGWEAEVGVILDFCSLWQRGCDPAKDKRSEVELQEFKTGLKEINTPYAHKEITAVKLTPVPDNVQRTYEDRGWTLFESIIIDGKAKQENRITMPVDFDPSPDTSLMKLNSGIHFIRKYNVGNPQLPCTPKRFEQKLTERKRHAEQKGVNLFTSGSDQPFVLDKYQQAFDEQTRAQELAFAQLGWGPEDAGVLAGFLMHCHCLQKLTLQCNRIGDTGAEKLAEAMPSMTSPRNLILTSNQIGDAGAERLAEALPSTASLRNLILESNEIGDAGAERLAEALPSTASLQELCLSQNRIADAGAERLAEATSMANLQVLDLSHNEIGDKVDLRKFARAKVKELRLYGQGALQGLFLFGDVATERLLEAMPSMTSLRVLDLSKNRITDVGAEKLAEAMAMPSMPSLEKFYLGFNQFGMVGAEKLGEALPNMKRLVIFLGSCNGFRSDGWGGAYEKVVELVKERNKRCPENLTILHENLQHKQAAVQAWIQKEAEAKEVEEAKKLQRIRGYAEESQAKLEKEIQELEKEVDEAKEAQAIDDAVADLRRAVAEEKKERLRKQEEEKERLRKQEEEKERLRKQEEEKETAEEAVAEHLRRKAKDAALQAAANGTLDALLAQRFSPPVPASEEEEAAPPPPTPAEKVIEASTVEEKATPLAPTLEELAQAERA